MMLARDRGRDATLGLIWSFARFDIEERLRAVRHRLGFLQLQDLTERADRVPDSPLAKAAFELAAGLSSPLLLNHAVRTYAFGAILASRNGLQLDRELLYVASVLHDLGLTPTHEADPGSFEWVGAKRARAFGLEQGMEARRVDLLYDAIALHSSVGIASSREPEIAMVHYGAGADLFGTRLVEIPPFDLDRLLDEWPRCGFKTDFPACLERQVELKPESHIAGAMGLGLAGRVRAAPFAE
ncbi:MAG: HD domain-containing protein [bacterium]|nr:HD domain-containing protein [bacterium]